MANVSLVATAVAGAAGMFVGFMWYSDPLFGIRWRKGVYLSDEQTEKAKKEGMAKQLILGSLAELIMAFAFGLLVALTSLNPFMVAVITFWFAFPIFLGNVLWQRLSWEVFAIDSGHRMVELAAFALVFTLL